MIELRIVQVHADSRILAGSNSDRIDPDKWHPLIMSFRQFYGIDEQVHPSRLGKGPEEAYAPWKLSGLKSVAGKVLSKWARYKYRV